MAHLNPEQLMRSRYDAFVRKDSDYLNSTQTKQVLSYDDTFDNVKWLKLDVLDAYDNIVEFKAYFSRDGLMDVLHEKSSFVLVDDAYLYDTGKLYKTSILRNETCPCGSGKKFKKCCMKN